MGSAAEFRSTLGTRIREAREALSWSQEELATLVGLGSAQIVSSIETGQRDVKARELFAIARALHVSVEALLRGEPLAPTSVEWRERSGSASSEIEAKFLERCRRYRLLEEWCEVPSPQQLNPLQLRPDPTFESVQSEADKVCRYMELGGRPALSLARTLEEDYGVKILHEDLSEQGAGLSAKGDFGLAILLNSNDAPWRRNFTLAHELFHLLIHSEELSVTLERLEQLANAFASQLLLPAGAIMDSVNARLKERELLCSDLIEIAREFCVSSEALLWRLVSMRRVSRESVAALLKDESFRSMDRASFPLRQPPPSLPDRYVRLCLSAFGKGKLGLAKLADFLEMSLVDLADEIEYPGPETQDGAEARIAVS